MRIFLSIVGIIGSYFILRYREAIGNMIGEAEWMRKVGGVYTFVILVALVLFFWSLAELTGTTGVLFSPFQRLPGQQQQVNEMEMPITD